PDLVTSEVADELVQLQDDLAPFDTVRALDIIKEELALAEDQHAASKLLSSLQDAEPVAAASLGQVYQ
ncbi:unnamed protein product, partial [Symbiodinium necroappetens]